MIISKIPIDELFKPPQLKTHGVMEAKKYIVLLMLLVSFVTLGIYVFLHLRIQFIYGRVNLSGKKHGSDGVLERFRESMDEIEAAVGLNDRLVPDVKYDLVVSISMITAQL